MASQQDGVRQNLGSGYARELTSNIITDKAQMVVSRSVARISDWVRSISRCSTPDGRKPWEIRDIAIDVLHNHNFWKHTRGHLITRGAGLAWAIERSVRVLQVRISGVVYCTIQTSLESGKSRKPLGPVHTINCRSINVARRRWQL